MKPYNNENILIPCFNIRLNESLVMNTPELSIQRGKVYLVSGCNGSGKSTWLKRIHKFFCEQSNHHCSLLMDQKYHDILYQYKPVWWNVCMPQLVKASVTKSEAKQLCRQTFEELGVEKEKTKEMMNKHPHKSSGGECQLMIVARFLNATQDILLMDEPFSALDPKKHKLTIESLQQCALNHSKAIIIISHFVYITKQTSILTEFEGFWKALLAISKLE